MSNNKGTAIDKLINYHMAKKRFRDKVVQADFLLSSSVIGLTCVTLGVAEF